MNKVPFLALAVALAAVGCPQKKQESGAKSTGASEDEEGNKTSKSGKKGDQGDDEDEPKKPAGKSSSGCKLPKDGEILADVTFTKGCTLDVTVDLHVRDGVTLTIEKGVTLRFGAERSLWVTYGKLVAKGTDDDPIVFTSSNKDPAAGDWEGIFFEDKITSGIVLDHVKIEYAGHGGSFGKGAVNFYGESNGDRVTITNSIIQNNEQSAVFNDKPKSKFKFENNILKKNKTSLELWANHLGSIGPNKFGDPVRIHGDIETTAKWPAMDVPVVVTDSVRVQGKNEAAILTMPDKLTVKFNAGNHLWIGDANGGGLNANGVTFTSANGTPAAGDWEGIIFGEKATSSLLEGCTIEYAGHEGGWGKAAAITFHGTTAKKLKAVKVKNSTFRKSGKFGIYSDDSCGELDDKGSGNKAEGGMALCNKPDAD